ncbi:MAG TPA: heparinase II/III family protein, partial [Pyrinomonadaceae bacterium]
MSAILSKLKKLKGRSLSELRVRGAQALAAYAERGGLTTRGRFPSDVAFFRLLDASQFGDATLSAQGLLDHFRSRRRPGFFAAFDDRGETVKEFRRRFGHHAEDVLVARADRITEGRFDLLGLRDLHFGTPPDWHLEPVSKKRAPLVHWSRINYLDANVAGDKKIVWELNRQQYFAALGRAYWLTGEEKYAETFARHLESWMDENPPKLGVNWASSLEVSFRSISWLWALHFFKDSPQLTPALFLRALKYLYLHARHLETYLSTYFSPNTHLTGEALGLFYAGTLWPELRAAARWRETGLCVLLSSLDWHVRADGVYFEQSSYYHRYTTDFYTHLLLLARANGQDLDVKVGRKLRALLDHLMHVQRPDGTTPLFGDDDGGRLVFLDERAADDFRATLSNGAAIFSRGDYKHVA